MSTNGADPHRVLGVARDATEDEVRRAYRALAKRHHPDAGQGSVARFLEIQAAYETLLGSRPAAKSRGPAAAGGRTARRPAQPAGSTSDAAANGGPGGGAARPGTSSGTAPGSDWARRPRGGSARRAGPETRAGSGPARPAGSPGGGAQAGAGAAGGGQAGEPSRGRRAPGRRRATLGSTSYDEAEEVFEPDWSGASWYGPSSGTYWTLNPREYADPRKHGPEYQARARRHVPGAGGGAAPGAEPSTRTGPATGDESAAGPEPARGGPSRGSPPGGGAPLGGERARARAYESESRTYATSGGRPAARPDELPSDWGAGRWSADATSAGAAPFAHAANPGERAAPPGPGPAPAASPRADARPTPGPGPAWRATLAVLGWIVPGLALAVAAGGPGGLLATMPLQVAGVVLLAFAPRAAWAAVGGGLALVFATVPIVATVAALGGRFVAGGPAPASALVLASLAWLGGVLIVAAGRVAPYPWRDGARR